MIADLYIVLKDDIDIVVDILNGVKNILPCDKIQFALYLNTDADKNSKLELQCFLSDGQNIIIHHKLQHIIAFTSQIEGQLIVDMMTALIRAVDAYSQEDGVKK